MNNCFVKKMAFNIPAFFVFSLAMISWGSSAPIIQHRDSKEGRIESVLIEKASVKGRIFRVIPYHMTPGAHVHVSLIDAQGKVIESAIDRLSIMMPKEDAHQRLSPFQVNFVGDVSRANTIQVTYLVKSHSLCR